MKIKMRVSNFVLVSLAALTAGIIWLSQTAPAKALFIDPGDPGDPTISNQSPDPTSLKWQPPCCAYPGNGPLNGDQQPYYVVGNSINYKANSEIKIYVKSGFPVTVTVNNAGAGCQTALTENGAAGGPDYNINGTNNGPPTTFWLRGTSGKFSVNQSTDGSDGCAAVSFTPPVSAIQANMYCLFGNTGSGCNPISGVPYDGFFYLEVVAQFPCITLCGENSFTVQTSSSSFTGGSTAFTGYGFRDSVPPRTPGWTNAHWTQEIQFAVEQDCTNIGQPVTTYINYADLDLHPDLYNDPNLRLALQERTFGGTSWQNVVASFSPSGNFGRINRTFDTSHVYRLLLQNVGTENTIFIRIPNRLSEQAMKYHLTPSDCISASCKVTSPATGLTIPVASPTTVSVQGMSSPPVGWVRDGGPGYYVKRIGSTDGEPNYATLSGNNPYTDTVNPPIGTTSVIYTYSVYDSSGNTVGPPCTVKYNVGSLASSFTCSASVISPTQVRVTLTNTASSRQGKNYQLRQSPDPVYKLGKPRTPSYEEWPIAPGFTANFPPGASASFTFTRPANAIENYTLYNGPASNSSATVVGPSPLCGVNPGSVSMSCNGSSAPDPAEVGQTGTFSFSFKVVNTTTGTATINYGSSPPSPAGSLTSISSPSPPSSSVAPTGSGGQLFSVTYSAMMNTNGTFYATATYNSTTITCSQPVIVVSLPYFQAWNSDVSTGGGFGVRTNNPLAIGSCATSDVTPFLSGNAYSGGIIAYGRQIDSSARRVDYGSQVDFGAVAMGYIYGQSTGDFGFFSGSPISPPNQTPLFANSTANASNLGGYLDGTGHCIKDYYDDTMASTTATPRGSLQADISSCPGSCQYVLPAGNVTIRGVSSFPDGKQVTLYVDGNVTITGDIAYPSQFDPSSPSDIPYLTIIAKGNIVLTDGVSRLDGLYIAQPTSGTDGIFATCNNYSDSQDVSNSTNSCNQQLVVNGAVIARKVELLRSHGTLDPPGGGDPNQIGANPAEIFNFPPSMVMGIPAFVGQAEPSSGLFFSLSPVF